MTTQSRTQNYFREQEHSDLKLELSTRCQELQEYLEKEILEKDTLEEENIDQEKLKYLLTDLLDTIKLCDKKQITFEKEEI